MVFTPTAAFPGFGAGGTNIGGGLNKALLQPYRLIIIIVRPSITLAISIGIFPAFTPGRVLFKNICKVGIHIIGIGRGYLNLSG